MIAFLQGSIVLTLSRQECAKSLKESQGALKSMKNATDFMSAQERQQVCQEASIARVLLKPSTMVLFLCFLVFFFAFLMLFSYFWRFLALFDAKGTGKQIFTFFTTLCFCLYLATILVRCQWKWRLLLLETRHTMACVKKEKETFFSCGFLILRGCT